MANINDRGEHPRTMGPAKTEGVSGMAGQVKEKASELVSQAGSRLGGTWEGAKQGVQQAACSVEKTAKNAWEEVQSGAATVSSTAQEALQDFSGFVRRHPVECVAAGFVLGCLCGMAFAARSPADHMTRRMSKSSA